ncbi:MAG: hypothetical protein QXT93_10135, partial [Thermofilum sp.]
PTSSSGFQDGIYDYVAAVAVLKGCTYRSGILVSDGAVEEVIHLVDEGVLPPIMWPGGQYLSMYGCLLSVTRTVLQPVKPFSSHSLR